MLHKRGPCQGHDLAGAILDWGKGMTGQCPRGDAGWVARHPCTFVSLASWSGGSGGVRHGRLAAPEPAASRADAGRRHGAHVAVTRLDRAPGG